jgi:hypothetical protein
VRLGTSRVLIIPVFPVREQCLTHSWGWVNICWMNKYIRPLLMEGLCQGCWIPTSTSSL